MKKELLLKKEEKNFFSKRDRKNVDYTEFSVNVNVQNKDYDIVLIVGDLLAKDLLSDALDKNEILPLQMEEDFMINDQGERIDYVTFFVNVKVDNEDFAISLKPRDKTAKSVLVNQLKKITASTEKGVVTNG